MFFQKYNKIFHYWQTLYGLCIKGMTIQYKFVVKEKENHIQVFWNLNKNDKSLTLSFADIEGIK